MDKKKISRIRVMMIAVATVALVFSTAGCGCNNEKKTEVTDANGNVITSVNEDAPTQTDKNGKVIKGKKSDVNVDNADKSNGDDVNDLVNDKDNNKSSKDGKSSKNGKSSKSSKKSDSKKGSSKKGDSKKGDKKSDKGGNFDVKDEDDEPGFGPLIDG